MTCDQILKTVPPFFLAIFTAPILAGIQLLTSYASTEGFATLLSTSCVYWQCTFPIARARTPTSNYDRSTTSRTNLTCRFFEFRTRRGPDILQRHPERRNAPTLRPAIERHIFDILVHISATPRSYLVDEPPPSRSRGAQFMSTRMQTWSPLSTTRSSHTMPFVDGELCKLSDMELIAPSARELQS